MAYTIPYRSQYTLYICFCDYSFALWIRQTPLHYAVWRNLLSECVILTAFGADASIRNKDGKTPLDDAIDRNCDSRMISLLQFPFTPTLRSEMRAKKIYTMEKWEAFQQEKTRNEIPPKI
eukprot:c3291_g1_i2.p1 GENE.c3291_g1_i2~~c3291_g1_i2.p1  ORF type:complete len:120 (-),score=11.27 c3291_g1_i2:123-482(-)